MARPHFYLSSAQVDDYVKVGRMEWVEPGQLARKTFLYNVQRQERTIERKTGKWIPIPSPAPRSDGIFRDGYFGPTNEVLQFI